MSRRNWILLIVALALMAGTAGLLGRVGGHQALGAPGVKTRPTKDPARLEVVLPEQVLDYKSEVVEVDEVTLGTLPKDTSFGQRKYEASDGFPMSLNAVLMGTDRTSLHKPQFCLEGQGWHIDQGASLETSVPVESPLPYALPVVRLVASKEGTANGQPQVLRGIYVYWFVAEDGLSSSVSGFQRMWMMGSKLLRTGVLQRWAYVSCFSVCAPGQEEVTFQRMKVFIAAAVPEFQLNPRPPGTEAAARN
jgi:hypothetical protein